MGVRDDYFTYAGTASTAYGCVIQTRPSYIAPERIVERFSVRGRSGDLIIDTGSYSNVSRAYNVFVPHANVSDFVNWLKSQVGYQRLEDTYETDVYRKAACITEFEADNIFGQFNTAEIVFDCKPQRYLKSGETATTLTTSGGTMYNAYEEALPLITINGSGNVTLSINNNSASITGVSGSITLDAETQNCYKGTINLNSTVTLTNKFPVLEKGSNIISWTGTVSSVVITPRWWKI